MTEEPAWGLRADVWQLMGLLGQVPDAELHKAVAVIDQMQLEVEKIRETHLADHRSKAVRKAFCSFDEAFDRLVKMAPSYTTAALEQVDLHLQKLQIEAGLAEDEQIVRSRLAEFIVVAVASMLPSRERARYVEELWGQMVDLPRWRQQLYGFDLLVGVLRLRRALNQKAADQLNRQRSAWSATGSTKAATTYKQSHSPPRSV